MVSHACLRVEAAVEETVETFLSPHPFNHVNETVWCPGKLDQGGIDLCLKPGVYLLIFVLAGSVLPHTGF